MLKSIIVILIGVIIFLAGIIIVITENFATETYWVGLAFVLLGIAISALTVFGKIKGEF